MNENVIYSINGPVVTVKDTDAFSMLEMVYVGNARLIGEVISIKKEFTTIQVYETTTGLKPGEPVYPTGQPISVTLGPGILRNIFDGIERPLEEIAKESGSFIPTGSHVDPLDKNKLWDVTVVAKVGDQVQGGDVYATIPETDLIMHKCMVSPYTKGKVIEVAPSGQYKIDDVVMKIEDEEGKIIVDANGKPVKNKSIDVDMLPYRKKMQMVFQDPYSSLNPRMTVEDIIGEPLDVHKLYSSRAERRDRILELMGYVGLNAEHATRYAHEFSGGQRQRIGIARALAVRPKFIVCDEPVSALDVSIQAQVVNMFEDLQKKFGMAYLFIAHDLLIVQHISDRIAVMYLGKMMEIAPSDELNNHPLHPYTLSLLSAVPIPDPETARKSHRIVLEGDVPSPLNMPSGCPFRTRCAYATEQCAKEMPPLTDRGGEHFVACWNK